MKDDELLRYSRQIMLPQIDITGQQALLAAHILIVGAGGLGAAAIQYLAAAGVGHITVIDDDVVELSNLQRQTIYRENDVGRSKAEAAADACGRINSNIVVNVVNKRCDEHWLSGEAGRLAVHVLVDCTDNADVRYQINRFCLSHKIPWVSAAAIGLSGQIAVFDPNHLDSPCYRCLYPNLSSQSLNCSDSGVLSPLVGHVGCLQAIETIRLLAPFGDSQVGWLRTLDLNTGDWRRLRLPVNTQCPDCQTL